MERTPRAQGRTCVGCRGQADAAALVRCVRSPDGRVAPDLGHKLGGRGAHVHMKRACVEAAVRGGLARSFSAKVTATADELCALIAAQCDARVAGLVLAANRTRALEVGTDAVLAALRGGAAALVVVAADARGKRADIEGQAMLSGTRCYEHGDKATWGRMVARDELAVFAVTDRRIADEIARMLDDRKALLEVG
ncbi:MAG: YlxR family protein [Polyangiales bacterium]|nr:YlxR family protein [Myxococcales bacterium]